MKKRIEEKAKKLKTMFVTTSIFNREQIDRDEYRGCKYFILFHNTYKVVGGFKTQIELEWRLDDILENGVHGDGCIFFYEHN